MSESSLRNKIPISEPEISGNEWKRLQGIKGLSLPLPQPASDVHHVYHQYTISTTKRDKLQHHLKEKGVSTMVYYPFPLHKMKVFGEGRSKIVGNFDSAEQASEGVLSLPIEPLQGEEETMYVVKTIKEYFQ